MLRNFYLFSLLVSTSATFPPEFTEFVYYNSQIFHTLPLKSVTPNLVASLVFFGIAFSFKIFISSSETSTNREAAILEISAPAIITSRGVIIATYDAILDQSDHENLYNHLSNYTNIGYSPVLAGVYSVTWGV